MADTCCAPVPPSASDRARGICPGCGGRGRPLELATVQAQVASSLRELAQGGYHFCPSAGCAIVYFTSGGSAIHHDQLRERVFQKGPGDDVLVCYCFRYRVGAFQRGSSTERATILADIVAGTQQGQCACTVRNPQGSCCLGNVRSLITRLAGEAQPSQVDQRMSSAWPLTSMAVSSS